MKALRNAVRSSLVALALASPLLQPGRAHADAAAPSLKEPRSRTCCALASHLPLHLGAAHIPISLGIVTSPASLGPHSYLGNSVAQEANGIIYTRRGGFIDTGHTREYSDLTAHLILQLRPLLARGEGVLRLRPRDGEVLVRVTARVPEALLDRTSVSLAQRIAFQISVWVEVTQYYGHTVVRGAEEYFSAFTPEDLYSNLLGTYLGAAALASPLPYDAAMTTLFLDTLRVLQATPAAEARRILAALDGRWWRADTAWPSKDIPITRSFDIGPHMSPVLAPVDVAPPGVPVSLDVPEVDGGGAPLAALYRLEIVPDLRSLPRFTDAGRFPVVTGEDIPRLVAIVRAAEAGAPVPPLTPVDGEGRGGALAHYLVGLRLIELNATGGAAAGVSGSTRGVLGGSLTGIRGDTRGGDFAMMRFDVNHTAERGLIASFAFFRSDALFFCHDREMGSLRPPLISLLGPCARGEWFGVGGSIGEAFHDGRTGRTALRPLSAFGVLDVVGNGQSPSYDDVRVLLRAGGAVEHVWTEAEGGTTIPRVSGNAVVLARTGARRFEAYGTTGYRLDPGTPRDAAFESSLTLRWYLLLGGRAAPVVDGVDAWGVGSLGLQAAHSFWTRPRRSYAELTPPFVSAERSSTWQLLLTATLGFQGLTF